MDNNGTHRMELVSLNHSVRDDEVMEDEVQEPGSSLAKKAAINAQVHRHCDVPAASRLRPSIAEISSATSMLLCEGRTPFWGRSLSSAMLGMSSCQVVESL
ncbi:hypothetical protein Ddc_22443 [Ditylenchus destructor]|nr:hypothetical protein Ddc_22443 [Ditylenchus destructor]